MKESAQAIGFAFVLALVALYMILASQFNSFSQPAIIMLTAPLVVRRRVRGAVVSPAWR